MCPPGQQPLFQGNILGRIHRDDQLFVLQSGLDILKLLFMASVQSIGYPQNSRKLGDRKIIPSTDRIVLAHQIIIIKLQMIIFDYIGHDFPLYMGQSYDLRRHNDMIGAFSQIDQADVFPTVMQKRCDSQ